MIWTAFTPEGEEIVGDGPGVPTLLEELVVVVAEGHPQSVATPAGKRKSFNQVCVFKQLSLSTSRARAFLIA